MSLEAASERVCFLIGLGLRSGLQAPIPRPTSPEGPRVEKSESCHFLNGSPLLLAAPLTSGTPLGCGQAWGQSAPHSPLWGSALRSLPSLRL